ncbi:transglutaminase domain-containing protein [uncultured Marixanthomonas sp.]|uniref:transglutaminase domain-containing protein n=1 Tax=uncultured Marixanthomonas sp. TaxID=757245 RepID=UPI0030DB546A|tara:strand:+ start:275520 stop:276179 length:660 start_codon:yes stop_codon:yes gene_type:complete
MGKYTLVIFLCIGLSVMNGYAQIGDVINTRVSSERVKVSKKGMPINTKSLAKQITKYSRTDFEKAKAIFLWIASNIEYDNELRTDANLQKSIYTSEYNVLKSVLKRKKALCGGYAFLYGELCKQAGIESQVIHGYSKKYYSTNNRKQVDHTWNAVKINGKWHLLDISLASSQKRNHKPNMYWFNTDPTYFIKTHYPEDIKWTLMSNPISKKEFEQLPTI